MRNPNVDEMLQTMSDMAKKLDEENRIYKAYVADWHKLVDRICLDGALRATVQIQHSQFLLGMGGRFFLTVMARVPERDCEVIVPISSTLELPRPEFCPTDAKKMALVRKMLHIIYMHEADEQFRLLNEGEKVPTKAPVTASQGVSIALGGKPPPNPTVNFTRPFDPHAGAGEQVLIDQFLQELKAQP